MCCNEARSTYSSYINTYLVVYSIHIHITECAYVLVGTFSCIKKARERELATFDENRRAVGMLTLCAIEIEGTYRGEEGTTPVTTACPEDPPTS